MGNAKSKKAAVQYFEQSALKVLLPIAEFKTLTMRFNVRKFQDGQEICIIGHPCQVFYMAGTGAIALFLADGSGQPVEVTRCSPGMGINPEVLQTGTAQVTAKAIGAVTCFSLHQKKWNEWAAIYPSSAQRVLAAFQPKAADMFREFPIVNPELLSEKQIQYLSRLLHLEVHPEGTVVYQQYVKPPSPVGDPGKTPPKINHSPTNDGKVYILHDGVYEAYKKPEADKQPEVKLGDCTRQGEYFGAIALFMLASRTETVEAVKPSLSFSLSKDDLFGFIQRHADVRAMYVSALKQIMPDHFASSKNLLFEGVPEDQFGPLLQACEWTLYHPDQVVFREGDVGDSFYIVLFGNLGMT